MVGSGSVRTVASMERPTRIVIAGGGVGALEAAIALRALVGAEPPVTLVAPNDYFVYQPLSVAEPFALGPTPRLSLEDFANDLDVEWRQAAVDAVGETHAVLLEGGGFVAYDKLIVAVGAPREAAYENATTFRGEHDVQSVHGLVQASRWASSAASPSSSRTASPGRCRSTSWR